MKETILEIITTAVKEINEELENPSLDNPTPQTRLFGSGGALDSLALVSLIADVEERISDHFDRSVILADERAMSQRTSPFRDIASLSEYIEKLLHE